MDKNKYPRYISNKPKGEDNFSGGSHETIAIKVSNIIKKDLLETKIIGLEGNWGSGKSNVVKMIQKELAEENYHTFIYDAWGNQEDLTRRSFLEQIIDELFNENLLKNKERWKKLEAQLLAKSSKSFKQKFPKIKSHWFYITFSIVLMGVLSSFYQNVLLQTDFFTIKFYYWKPILSIYFIPSIFFAIGTVQIIKEYLSKREENKKRRPKEQESKWDTLGKILYWFSGKDIETEETERIIEEEPSLLMFRDYFLKIENDIKENGKLIIVFDNLDRLDGEKIKSLWSSIHTFFAEGKDKFNSYIIIPYNHNEMIVHFGGDKSGLGFLEKSIPINFRITPPIVTDWENFLNNKINEAFGEEIIEKSDRDMCVSLFDSLTEEKVIMPRKIINYVNDLVSLYWRWEEEIKKSTIKLKYISLFHFKKNEILKNPYSVIPTREYLKKVDNLFQDKQELDETIASLTFGVDRKNANEVLLLREFQNCLRNGKPAQLLKTADHTAFKNYFNKAYYSTDMIGKINHLSEILNALSDKLNPLTLKSYWNNFAKEILRFEEEFSQFSENHKQILLNANQILSKAVVEKLISSLKSKLSDKKEEDQITYYKEVISLEEFIKNQESIDLDIKKMLSLVNFDVKPYIEFVNGHPTEFNDYKISCEESAIEEFAFDESKNLNISTLSDYLEEYKAIKYKRKCDFSRLKESLKNAFKGLPHNKKEELSKLVEIVKALFDKPVSLTMSPTFYSHLTIAKLDSHDAYIDSYCIAISDFKSAINQANFQNSLKSLNDEHTKKIYKRIEWYLDYGGLLKLTTENSTARRYAKLKDIADGLTQNKQGKSKLVLDWALQNFSSIVTNTFNSDVTKESKFIERLEGWEKRFSTNIEDIDIKVFSHINIKDNTLIDKIVSKSLNYIDNLSKEDLYTAFKDKNKVYNILKSLVENKLITNFSSLFYSAFDDYFKNIARQEESEDNFSFWNSLLELMDARILKSTFTSIRDILLSERGEVSENDIKFFYKGLISYGNLHKKPDGSTLKFIIPMIKSNQIIEIFLNNKKELMKIIELSEHKETAISELKTMYKSKSFNDNKIMKSIAEEFGWDAQEKD